MKPSKRVIYNRSRRTILKLRAIEYKGGRCSICGYNKCIAALEFHHRDPTQKEFHWGRMKCSTWNGIVTEIDKCDLLCANCHREIHYNSGTIKEAVSVINAIQPIVKRPNKICETCQREFNPCRGTVGRYCSPKCSQEGNRKINWPNNLNELVANSSLRAVGILLGVSDKAVKKRLNVLENQIASMV